MSDHTGYFDEDGNELTPEEVAALGDDVEIVEEVEAPAAQQPAAETPAPSASAPAAQRGRVPKALLAGVAVLVLAVGGGVAYGMHSLGQQNTVEDVKQDVAAKSSKAREAVEDKKEEVRESVSPSAEPEPVRTGTRVTGAACLDPAAAQWDGEGDPPDHRLRQEAAAKLPSSVSARVKKRDSRNPSEIAITQPEKARLFVYASDPAGIYTRATVSIAGGLPVVLGSGNVVEVGMDGNDVCPTSVRPTEYAVVDGKREKAVEIVASKSVGDTMYGVTSAGDIAELTLEEVETEESDETAAEETDEADEAAESEPTEDEK